MKVLTPGVLKLAEPHTLDENVLLAYPVSRVLADRTLAIGPDAVIRSGTVIYCGSAIGAKLQTGHNVVIREENRIGDNFRCWNNTVIDYGCVIGTDVKIHCNCYLAQFSILEDGVFFAPGVTVANDLHPGCAQSAECMKGPLIKAGVQVGVNATLLPMITIGEHALIAAGAVVTKDVPAYAVVAGSPARVINDVRKLACRTGVNPAGQPYRF